MALPIIGIDRALQYLKRGHRLIYRELPHLGESIFIIAVRPKRGYPLTWKYPKGLATVEFHDMQKVMGRALIMGDIKNITPKFLMTEFYEKWYEWDAEGGMDAAMLVKKRNKQPGS